MLRDGLRGHLAFKSYVFYNASPIRIQIFISLTICILPRIQRQTIQRLPTMASNEIQTGRPKCTQMVLTECLSYDHPNNAFPNQFTSETLSNEISCVDLGTMLEESGCRNFALSTEAPRSLQFEQSTRGNLRPGDFLNETATNVSGSKGGFPCRDCQSGTFFATSLELEAHAKLCGHRPYLCNQGTCRGKTFPRRDTYVRHMSTFHNVRSRNRKLKVHECKLCLVGENTFRRFKRKEELLRHQMLDHAPDSPQSSPVAQAPYQSAKSSSDSLLGLPFPTIEDNPSPLSTSSTTTDFDPTVKEPSPMNDLYGNTGQGDGPPTSGMMLLQSENSVRFFSIQTCPGFNSPFLQPWPQPEMTPARPLPIGGWG